MGERLPARGAYMGESMSKKGGFALIEPYAEMGMYPAEIRDALSIEHEISASSLSIGVVLNKARQMGQLRQLTPEEQQDIKKDQNSQSKRQARDQSVLRWLFAKAILTVYNESLPEKSVVLPQGRLGWKDAIKKLDQDGLLDDIISHTKPLILRHMPLIDTVKIYKSPATGAMSHQEKSFAFVHKCLEEGLIGEDLSSWHDVHALYELHNRSFIKDPSKRIRLEVWFRARNTTGEKGMQLLLKYKKLGEEIGSYWFDNSLVWDEDFIASSINSANDGEVHDGEDDRESHRMKSGIRGEAIAVDDRGQVIYDNPSLRERRARSREMIEKEADPIRRPYSSLG